MNIGKKFDRAFQWAGEKMGAEAKTSLPETFRLLENEMNLRVDGAERLQRGMNSYVKWLTRRADSSEDKDRSMPIAFLGYTMVTHGEDFEPDSEYGASLVSMGRTQQRLAGMQEQYAADATSTWLDCLDRTVAMMKEYQAARKKLENRRLAYDATLSKIQKARREDFRIEEEVRAARAKFDESTEDVARRMHDIKDAEVDATHDLSRFLDAELAYHERCVEELRRVRATVASGSQSPSGYDRRPSNRPRASTVGQATSRTSTGFSSTSDGYFGNGATSMATPPYDEDDLDPLPRILSRSNTSYRPSSRPLSPPSPPTRPPLSRTATSPMAPPPPPFERRSISATGPVGPRITRPVRTLTRVDTSQSAANVYRDDVFGDQHSDTASSTSPEWTERSASPATSMASSSTSLARYATTGTTNGPTSTRKPPPPPPSRATKPTPPPVPVKRSGL